MKKIKVSTLYELINLANLDDKSEPSQPHILVVVDLTIPLDLMSLVLITKCKD